MTGFRIKKILWFVVVGALCAVLGRGLARFLPKSWSEKQAKSVTVAVLLDTGSFDNNQWERESPIARAAYEFSRRVKAEGTLKRDVWGCTFNDTAQATPITKFNPIITVPAINGGLEQAIKLAKTTLGSKPGAKYLVIFLNRPSVSFEATETARLLREQGWMIMVYGAPKCNANSIRQLVEPPERAFRVESSAKMPDMTNRAVQQYLRAEPTLVESGLDNSPLGGALKKAILGLLLALGLGLVECRMSRTSWIPSIYAGLVAALLALAAGLFLGPLGAGLWLWGVPAVVAVLFAQPTKILAGTVGGFVLWALIGIMPMADKWQVFLFLGAALGFLLGVGQFFPFGPTVFVKTGSAETWFKLGRKPVEVGSGPDADVHLPVMADSLGSFFAKGQTPYFLDEMTKKISTLPTPGKLTLGVLEVESSGLPPVFAEPAPEAPAAAPAPEPKNPFRSVPESYAEAPAPEPKQAEVPAFIAGPTPTAASTTDSAPIAPTGPLGLAMEGGLVRLDVGTELTMDNCPSAFPGPGGAVGMVLPHPTLEGTMGMQNRSGASWMVQTPEGRTLTVAVGKTIRLIPGSIISFGQGRATVVEIGKPGED